MPLTWRIALQERAPITDSDTRPTGGLTPALSQAEHPMILHEKQLVVDKKITAVERVTLITDFITEQRELSEQVRTEQIDRHH